VRLRGADLRGALLDGCDVDGVDWTGVRIDLAQAVLLARARGGRRRGGLSAPAGVVVPPLGHMLITTGPFGSRWTTRVPRHRPWDRDRCAAACCPACSSSP
jgi:hypothetical protein